MADEVLKFIVTGDTSKFTAELKNVEAQVKKLGETSKAAAAAIPKLPPIGNIFASEIAKAKSDLAGLTTAMSTTGETATVTASEMSVLSGAVTTLGGPMAIITGVITANALALGALGTAALQAGIQYDTAVKTIAGRTGETGASLESLGNDFLKTFSSVPQSAAEVTQVITLLHQRFDLTGSSLQKLSTDVLNFARVTGTPVQAALTGMVEVMSSWNVTADQAPALLSKLLVAFHKTGIPIAELTGTLESQDAVLKQYGFTLNDSISLLANLKKTGAEIPKILSGLNLAAPKFAASGISPEAGLQSAIDVIKNAPANEALALSKQLFGRGNANEFFDAIRSGAFDLAAMNAVLDESAGALHRAAAASLTLGDQFEILKHNAEALLTPLGSQLVSIIEHVMVPAFFVLARSILQNIVLLENFLYLIGIVPAPQLSASDIDKATHVGPKGAALAKSPAEITAISSKGVPLSTISHYTLDQLMQAGKKGAGGGDQLDRIANARQSVDDQIAALNHKALSGLAAQFDEIDRRYSKIILAESKTGGATRAGTLAEAARAATAAKIAERDTALAKAGIRIETEGGAGIFAVSPSTATRKAADDAQKEIDETLEKSSKAYITQIDNEHALQMAMNATENERLARIANLDDEIAIAEAAASGRNKNESEILKLLEEQRQAKRGVFGEELGKLERKQQLDQLLLVQRQYDETFSKVKAQAEGVFDAIFLRGKKGFAGLLDYIKGTFITGLKDLFGNVIATLFTGSRPGGGSAATGGIFGGLANAFGGLFGGGRSGGGGGGFNLGGLFGGGNQGGGVFSFGGGGGGPAASLAGLAPIIGKDAFGNYGLSTGTAGGGGGGGSFGGLAGAGQFGNIGKFLSGGFSGNLGTIGALTAGIGGGFLGGFGTGRALQIGGTRSLIAGGIGAGVGAVATAILGPQLGALVGAAAGALSALGLRLLFGKAKEAIFAKEIQRDFGINVPDNKLLKQIKNIGESQFGRDANKKRYETLRLDSVQGLLLNFATASGQDPSRLPIYQKFYGKGGVADNQRIDISRFARGGIVPGTDQGYDSVLSLLRPGEVVIPKAQFMQVGGAPIVVNINESKTPRETGREVVAQLGKLLGRDIGRRKFRDGLFVN